MGPAGQHTAAGVAQQRSASMGWFACSMHAGRRAVAATGGSLHSNIHTVSTRRWSHPLGSCRSFSSSSAGDSDQIEADPYKILGIDRNASADEIKAAYRKQALKWHPDRHPPEKRRDAERRFSAAANAYEVLSDPQKRQQYDIGGNHSGFPGNRYPQSGFPSGGVNSQEAAERLFREAFGGHSIEELFGQLFGEQRPQVLQVGMQVQVLPDAAVVLRACRASRIDTTNDAMRRTALGKPGRIVKVDPRDHSVKVQVEGVGNVWFGAGAVHPISGGSHGMGGFGGFAGLGGFSSGSTVQMKQEMVTLSDGRRAVRVTRIIRQRDGSYHHETVVTPLN